LVRGSGTEPMIRVGIILPEDKISNVEISIPDGVKIVADGTILSMTNKIELKAAAWGITIDGESYTSIEVKGNRFVDMNTIFPTIYPVMAGRRFHWETKISLNFPGTMEFNVQGGFIFATNILALEDYLACVATSEMSSECPVELIEAQTISARSWLLANAEGKHKDLNLDVCNDDCCQRYQGTNHVTEQSLQGIKNTRGKVLTYMDQVCDARYSKSCGGILEDYSTVWDGTSPPYLISHVDAIDTSINKIESEVDAKNWIMNQQDDCFCSSSKVSENELSRYIGAVDKTGHYFRWELLYSHAELLNIINAKLDLSAKTISRIRCLNRGMSGRVSKLEIHYIDSKNMNRSTILKSELTIRQTLHESTLYSSAIIIEPLKDFNKNVTHFKIFGAGWGHGVGLCQIGALGMALNGYSTESILGHYYPGTDINNYYH